MYGVVLIWEYPKCILGHHNDPVTYYMVALYFVASIFHFIIIMFVDVDIFI